MASYIQIFCVNTGEYLNIPGGSSLNDIVKMLGDKLDFTPICAWVNNKSEDMNYPVFSPKQVEFMDFHSQVGQRVYIRSLCMLLYKAISIELPDHCLKIEHSISRGYYCRLVCNSDHPVAVDAELCQRFISKMKELVALDIPFKRFEKLTSHVRELFKNEHLDDKVLLLDTTKDLYTVYYELDGTVDSYYGPLVPSTAFLKVFDIIPYKEGFLLLGPDPKNPSVAQTPEPQEKLYKAFTDYQKFNSIIRVSSVGELNETVMRRQTSKLINVAEAMHDKYLGRISDDIARRNAEGGARIVLLAGPSSSGKTTTCKRLAIQLMTNLMTPKMISLDDYFIDREHTPRDENGDYDFEHLHALDLDLLNSDLQKLLNGERINLPTYSFELGRRINKERPLQLDKGEVLLIEGIHGLNPELTSALNNDDIYKVYVSALTTLCIDNHNWISTNDNRLLRRIVRDYKYRNTSAFETIRRWPSVRRGEERWIFPFQENADALFNSSLIFEIGVMKAYADPLLAEVPHNVTQYAEAYRLRKLLSYFCTIPADQIPTTSLLREFLGGSSFHY